MNDFDKLPFPLTFYQMTFIGNYSDPKGTIDSLEQYVAHGHIDTYVISKRTDGTWGVWTKKFNKTEEERK